MATSAYILFAGDRQWHIGVASEAISIFPAPGDTAGVAALLSEKGWQGENILLALPSAWCLTASISTEGLPKKNRRPAMIFRLEEKLPLAAEDFVADFLAENGQALGVAVSLPTLRPVVEALDAAGVTVAAICPAVLLAMQEQLTAGDDADVLIWEEDDRVNLLILAGAAPKAWHLIPNSTHDVLLQLRVAAIAAGHKLHIRAGALTDPPMAAAIQSSPDVQSLTSHDTTLLASAAAAGAAILSGRREAPVNLRRDVLAMDDPYQRIARPLNFLASAAIIGLLCICAAMLWRAHRYDAVSDAREAEAAAIFHQALPGQQMPVEADVRARLESEERKLRAASGESPAGIVRISALTLLRDVLAALPADVRFRLSELRVGDASLYLQGQARTHSDAEVIAERLRSGGRFSLQVPRSEQLPDESVGFVITGTSTASPPAREATP